MTVLRMIDKRMYTMVVAGGLLVGQPGAAQTGTEDSTTTDRPGVNMGLKAGFNSTMFIIHELTVGGQKLEHLQNNYKVGYFGTLFFRFNLRHHHFLQTEATYSVSKGSIAAADWRENDPLLRTDMLVKSQIHSVAIPLLYGYKFVDAAPYQMSFFVGPQVTYIWKKHTSNTYTGFYQQDIEERFRPFSYSLTGGLAVSITNIFFDFRYETGLHNLTRSVNFDRTATEAPYDRQDIRIRRRRNVLSFSLGVIF